MSLEKDLERYYQAASEALVRRPNRVEGVEESVMAAKLAHQYNLGARDMAERLANPSADSSRLDYALGLETFPSSTDLDTNQKNNGSIKAGLEYIKSVFDGDCQDELPGSGEIRFEPIDKKIIPPVRSYGTDDQWPWNFKMKRSTD